MSYIWNFSPSLSDQVQQCVAAALKQDPQNKWFQEFGHLSRIQIPESLCAANVEQTQHAIAISSETNDVDDGASKAVPRNEETNEIGVQNIEEMIESVESEFSTRVDFIVEECVKNSNLVHALALKLSTNTVEKFCKHICDQKVNNKDFIVKYFEYFLPSYVKRTYNAGTLDILIRSYKSFPIHFKLLLQRLIKDVEIPNQVLQSFVESLNEEDRSNFIVNLSEFDLTSQEFSRSLFAIYTAYKDCKKSEQVQMYLQALLIQHSSYCVTDRHFGRLLLAFLQTHKALKIPINNVNIENIIETHRSPFKRPCFLLLKELTGESEENNSSSEDEND